MGCMWARLMIDYPDFQKTAKKQKEEDENEEEIYNNNNNKNRTQSRLEYVDRWCMCTVPVRCTWSRIWWFFVSKEQGKYLGKKYPRVCAWVCCCCIQQSLNEISDFEEDFASAHSTHSRINADMATIARRMAGEKQKVIPHSRLMAHVSRISEWCLLPPSQRMGNGEDRRKKETIPTETLEYCVNKVD